MTAALLASVLLIAACGLIYELVAGALASYLLGDSVTQFSTVIGTYLFAMGVGSWLSRFVARGLVARFVLVEIMVGVVGGFSSAILFLAFAFTSGFRLLLYALVFVIGWLRIRPAFVDRAVHDRAALITLGYLLFVMLYVYALGTLVELGENSRYRFVAEPFLAVATAVLATDAVRRLKARWAPRAPTHA